MIQIRWKQFPANQAVIISMGVLFALTGCVEPNSGQRTLRLGTTTSVENSGLLNTILPEFEQSYRAKVEIVAVGTGQALALGKRGDVDLVLVHAPVLEEEFMRMGYGLIREPVAYNDFVIAGPKVDGLNFEDFSTAADALSLIAEREKLFISRGDNSGTHIRELELWEVAGITPKPSKFWYLPVGQGMGSALNLANELEAYILSDRATFIAQQKNLPNLKILFGGNSAEENPDEIMLNHYSVIAINPEIASRVNAGLGEGFINWITSVPTQEMIAEHGLNQYGESLFFPNSKAWHQYENKGNISETNFNPEVTVGEDGLGEAFGLLLQMDTELLQIVQSTLTVSGTALIIACLLGIPGGVFLGMGRFPGRKYVQLIIYTGMGLPPVVVGLVVFLLLSNQGLFGFLNWLFTPTGMILAQSILAFPIVTGLTASAVGEVSPEVVSQIRSMGATIWQERLTIFRESHRGVAAAVLAAFGRIISEVGAVILVGGNIAGRTRVLSTAIVLETRQGSFELALAMGIMLLGIALMTNAFMMRFDRRWLN